METADQVRPASRLRTNANRGGVPWIFMSIGSVESAGAEPPRAETLAIRPPSPTGRALEARDPDTTGRDQRGPHMPAGRDCRTGGCKRKAAIVGDIEPVLVLDDPPHVAQKHGAPAVRQPADRTPGLAAVGGPVDIAGG